MSQFVSVISVIVVLGLIEVSHQCSCMWGFVDVSGESVPRSMCYGGTYVVARVTGKQKLQGPSGDFQIDGEIRFDVNIKKKYTKYGGVQQFPYGLQTSLFAPIPSSLCGYADLIIGKTYYISVYEDVGNKLTFNGCSFVRESNEVTNVQRQLMEGKLKCPLSPRDFQ